MNKCIQLLAAIALVAGHHSSTAALLDTNFQETLIVNAGSGVTGMGWMPDGSNRLLISRKAGTLTMVTNGVVVPTPFATVSPIVTTSECGLIGMCFDPNFVSNGYVYVFVTVSSSQQQIIRYTASGNVGINKTTIVSGLPTVGANHDGGAIGIGPDNKLYWGIGDLGNGTGVDGDLVSLAAKMGRANLDGTVAFGNPFSDGPGGNNDFIWARGFRNPYTMTFQPSTGDLWLNVVGTSYEQVFVIRRGDHAGWNDYENNQPAGYITPKIKYRTNGSDTRNIPAGGAIRAGSLTTITTTATHGFRKGEKITISGVADASFNGAFFIATVPSPTSFSFAQSLPDAVSGGGSAVTLNQGGALLGGCFLDVAGIPDSYFGNFFYGDFNSGRLMRATLDSSNEVTSVDYFASGFANCIDLSVGPDAALYHAVYGGNIYRIAYTNFPSQQILATPANVRMTEGGAAVFTARLAKAPAGNVVVNVARTSGDQDLSISSASVLSFSPETWAVPQVVQVNARTDDDAMNDVAYFTLSADGIPSQTVAVHATDLSGHFQTGPVTRSGAGETAPMQIGVQGEPGRSFVLEATSDLLLPWSAVATNYLLSPSTNVMDPASATLPMRFYRAKLLP